MRIQPDPDTLPALRPAASASTAGGEFATALTSARNSIDATLPEATDWSHVGERPLAERWGQYGSGATVKGYATPPDAAAFASFPVGADAPASPLNPGGITTTPSFMVDGYTGRGTPIPPGFYNLAYYEEYLRQGGTPLEGFPQMAEGSTYVETYGTFGDGRARATSFVAPPGEEPSPETSTPDPPCPPAAHAANTDTPAPAASDAPPVATRRASETTAPAAVARASDTPRPVTATTPPALASDSVLPSEGGSVRRAADAGRADDTTASDALRTALTRAPLAATDEALVRAEIAARLRDLLG